MTDDTPTPDETPKLTREALSYFKHRHNAPCGDPKCDSVYCYVAARIAELEAENARLRAFLAGLVDAEDCLLRNTDLWTRDAVVIEYDNAMAAIRRSVRPVQEEAET